MSARLKASGVFTPARSRVRPNGGTLGLFCLAFALVFPLGLLARRYAVPSAGAAGLTTAATAASDAATARDESRARGEAARARLSEAYGKLPLSFEARPAQKDSHANFAARGNNFGLYLDAKGATLALNRPAAGAKRGGAAAGEAVLRLSFVGANASPRVGGDGELPGKANYFIGGDRSKWRAGVATYERVRYENLYPGVDAVFYGNQGQLEYDFVLAPGADPRVLKLDFEGAKKISVAPNGDLVLRTAGGDVRQHKPVVYQEVAGVRREVAGRYVLEGGRRVAFKIGRYDRRLPLVVDPVLSYSTYLGGAGTDQNTAIAVDAAGNVYLTGSTTSANFPTLNPAQGALADFRDVFVTKLNPDGSAIVYSTYLGGSLDEFANGIAVDGGGNAYIAGDTISPDFPVMNPLQAKRASFQTDAFVAKLNPSGNALVYSTYLGGKASESGTAVAVDAAGHAHVTGATASTDFPTLNPLQAAKAGHNLFKSTDAGGNWTPRDNGLSNAFVFDLEITPGAPDVIYAATEQGVLKTTDGGANWANTGGALLDTTVQDVAVNPAAPSTVFAASEKGLYRSNDAGATWSEVPGIYANLAVAVAPTSPATIYAATFFEMQRSTDGGNTWTEAGSGSIFQNVTLFNVITVDPSNPAVVYAGTDRGVYKSINSGQNWSLPTSGIPTFASVLDVVIDRTNSNILYAAATSGVYKSTNAGASWTQLGGQTFTGLVVRAVAVDPSAPSNVVAATAVGGIFKSADGGASWTTAAVDLRGIPFQTLAVSPTSPSGFYAGSGFNSDAFVAKLSADGRSLLYSTFIGGQGSDQGAAIALDAAGGAHVAGLTISPDFRVSANALYQFYGGGNNDAFVAKLTPSGNALAYSTYLGGVGNDNANGVAVDSSGNAYVVGGTSSFNFPTTFNNAFQPIISGGTDAFVTKLNSAGTSLVFSTFLGGSSTDIARAVALDAGGRVHLAGQTGSSNFPITGAVQTALGGGGTDAFVAKLNPAGSGLDYSTFLGGTAVDQGFGIAVDAAGGAYVSGTTSSTFNFPLARPLQQSSAGGSDVFVAKLVAGIDLTLAVTDAPDPVTFGSDLTYTLTVQNKGELPATGVHVTDTLPAGATLVSAGASQGACAGTTVVRCDLGTVNPGASATMQIVVKPPAVRSAVNNAVVAANEADFNQANNTATTTTIVDFVDLSLAAAALPDTVAPGERLYYTFTVRNNGVLPAGSVNIVATLPEGVTYITCATSNGSCGVQGNNRTVTLPTLGANESQSVSLLIEVGFGLTHGTALPVTAVASSSRPDPDSSNNTATAVATVATTIPPKSNGKIAFTLYPDGLYVMNDDGTNITKIYTAEAGAVISLATWSPDGTKIAFVIEPQSSSFSTFQIRVVNADGSNPRTLSTNGARDSRPTWSPSSAYLAFVSRDRTAVQVVSTTGVPNERTLFTNTFNMADVSWSPGGRRMVFSTGNAELWTVDVDGGRPQRLDDDPNTVDTFPVWSPDGTKILFLRRFFNTQSGDVNIYTMNANGTDARPLPNPVGGTSSLQRPVFSPDGTKIAYEAPVGINGSNFLTSGILKVNADGTNITRVPPDGHGGSAPSWQQLPATNPPPPPVPTFKISGHVYPPFGQNSFLSGFVRLDLTGSRTASAFPDSDGNYSFTVPAGGNYTVTPATNPLYSFSPGGYTFNNLSANQGNADFTTAQIGISISGRVTREGGRPLFNLVMVLRRPGFPDRTTITAADGTYSFNNLDFNATYIVSVSPISRTHHTFTPDAAPFSLITESKVVDFVGAPVKQFEFTAERFNVGEGQGRGTVTVTRLGDTSGAASVDVRTFDNPAPVPCDPTVTKPDGSAYPAGQAYARCDYATTIETITWAAGDAQPKTVDIPIIDDAHKEGTENFALSLGNPQGGIIGYQEFTNLDIQDNDAVAGANPIYTTPFFVRQQYLDFLSREPEKGEPWTAVLDKCSDVNNNPACDRITVSAAFFGSPEFNLKGLYVFKFYRAAFNRRPTYEEVIFDMRSVTGATEQEVYQKRAAFPATFAARMEFVTLYAALSDAAFVNTLMDRYQIQQITTPDPTNPEGGAKVTLTRADLIARLGATGAQALTRPQVLRALVESNEVSAHEYNGAFVAMQYYGYLRRTPEEDGYQAWLRVINQDPNNVRLMVNGFMNSPEYRLRFGKP